MFKDAVVTLVGGLLLGWASWACAMGWLSRTWPTVEGTVGSSTLTRGFGRGGFHYDLAVVYSYQVEGTSYEGDTVDFAGASYSFASSGEKHFARYPVGARVRVYYNPNNPSRSVLEPGVSFWVVFAVVLACLFLVAGIRGLTGHDV